MQLRLVQTVARWWSEHLLHCWRSSGGHDANEVKANCCQVVIGALASLLDASGRAQRTIFPQMACAPPGAMCSACCARVWVSVTLTLAVTARPAR